MDILQKAVMVLGPTASGKTSFAVRLASRFPAEIVSADSRQIYRELDIGSGKDIGEYTLSGGTKIPVHLIDIADPAEDQVFSLADYLIAADKALRDISGRGKLPVICGGTALYLHGLLSRYHLHGGAPDETARVRLREKSPEELCAILRTINPEDEILMKEPNNRTRLIRRIEMLRQSDSTAETEKEKAVAEKRDFLILGVLRSREQVRNNIEKRLDARLNDGMLEEAVYLHDQCGVSWERMEFFGLEYRYMALYHQGKISFPEMRETLLCKIRQFAKRQDSWFRKMERDGFPIHWQDPSDIEKAQLLVQDFLDGKQVPPPDIRLADVLYGPKSSR